jgi:holo-[acyl-carrier protein] synthase
MCRLRLATGLDIIEISRIKTVIDRFGARFLERVFTPTELSEAGKSLASLAARFAAKEAVSKALGTGIGMVSWQDIEIRRGSSREPVLYLTGKAAERAEALGLQTWSISLSHTQNYATAVVVAVGQMN